MEISYCPSLDDSFPCGLWPPNLRWLEIGGLKKDISEPASLVTLILNVSEGLQHLTSLQHLGIWLCPKLRDLPETQLPSLLSLAVIECSPELRKKCSPGRRKGKYWSIISQIPRLTVRKTV
ncbi:putative leucine-rich repeat domain superfamily [Helianthus annuus]|nr:putative leucine-rich repeat domain superfamily [Helianthus annuus]KAJ0479565.1 putative leucine-rich repeat domain superfamily [Helianthus annuus]KAJ0496414.1 putative leucine-rich repeat domain superfamily [Helianthus annuus]KAJ0662473.1 putative leucine-rich repeat domain superfamily [Helianthus annuus]KAJ0670000.1 putative leucine-rich repeat domain superfamily [Helianthus annuus]